MTRYAPGTAVGESALAIRPAPGSAPGSAAAGLMTHRPRTVAATAAATDRRRGETNVTSGLLLRHVSADARTGARYAGIGAEATRVSRSSALRRNGRRVVIRWPRRGAGRP